MAQFVECPETDLPGLIATTGPPFAGLLEGIALEEPRYFMAARWEKWWGRPRSCRSRYSRWTRMCEATSRRS